MVSSTTYSHSVTFTMYGFTSIDSLIAALEKARTDVGSGNARVRVTVYDGDQRDPGSVTITVTG